MLIPSQQLAEGHNRLVKVSDADMCLMPLWCFRMISIECWDKTAHQKYIVDKLQFDSKIRYG